MFLAIPLLLLGLQLVLLRFVRPYQFLLALRRPLCLRPRLLRPCGRFLPVPVGLLCLLEPNGLLSGGESWSGFYIEGGSTSASRSALGLAGLSRAFRRWCACASFPCGSSPHRACSGLSRVARCCLPSSRGYVGRMGGDRP